MVKMKLKDKKIYLTKLIDYLGQNGWDLCNYSKQENSECNRLRMFGVALLHEKFEEVQAVVALFDEGKHDEAMDLYNSAIALVSDESMFEYYAHVLDDTNPWFV